MRRTKKRRRTSLIAVGAVLVQLAVLVVLADPSHAESSPSADEREQLTIKLEPDDLGQDVLDDLTIAPRQGTDTAAAPIVEPPPACDIKSLIGGQIDAYYINGLLELVEAQYWGGIECFQSAPHQEMLELRTTPTLEIDFGEISVPGRTARCVDDPPEDLCLFVFSDGSYLCAGTGCSGWYQVFNYMELIIDPNYEFTTWPEECIPLFYNDLLCYNATNTVYVSPTFP